MIKITNATFVKSAINPNDFPKRRLPEFAFLGRSNVGKSSIIRMIFGKKELVKTSSRPGMTQTINFYLVNDSFYFVDMPGFGYAQAPIKIKKSFYPMILNYIKSKRDIRIAFLLIDCRRTAEDFEKEIITILAENQIPTAIVITKSDKLSNNQLKEQINTIAHQLLIDKEDIIICSAKIGRGKKELLNLISNYLFSEKNS